ncbi:hypothetical protein TrVE_jg5736 [Triparma verrucosa]|uniref:Uncharacterized protein n=1 Tax=Triparma verrucosa TaxID=1606542 RepID=A0A9W7DLY1_9STRA|nr:hypothetical protein TrVE_jg5736 [Triparma verrucosa]
MKSFKLLLITLLQAISLSQAWVLLPPFACMCASGDGRLTDDYLSTLSATPDKFRATPAFYEMPVYDPETGMAKKAVPEVQALVESEEAEPKEVTKVVAEAQPLVGSFSEPARIRKRDRVKKFVKTKLKVGI